jgi:hypothetical protein
LLNDSLEERKMKFSTAFVLSAVMVALPSPSLMVKADPCIIGTYELEFDGGCNYATLLESFKHKYQTMIKTADCANDAETELMLHLGSPADPDAAARALCIPAWDNAFSVPFEDIARMPQADFEQRYYNGGTDWNEEVETLYEDPLGERSNILRVDAQRVRQFYEQESEHVRVDLPSYDGSDLTNNFDPSTCSTQAVMCCWTTDRQANDGNGNCDDPYDLRCVDKDPSDNTDLCYVDLDRGNTSTGFDSFEGTMVSNRSNHTSVFVSSRAVCSDFTFSPNSFCAGLLTFLLRSTPETIMMAKVPSIVMDMPGPKTNTTLRRVMRPTICFL